MLRGQWALYRFNFSIPIHLKVRQDILETIQIVYLSFIFVFIQLIFKKACTFFFLLFYFYVLFVSFASTKAPYTFVCMFLAGKIVVG